MSDVFISYSRKNSDFAHKLDAALTAAKRDVWIDWQDIARGEDWWHSIQVGVDSADTTLIIVTENWLVSEVCQRELAYVRQQNKRVFPIIREKVEGDLAIRVKGTWVDQAWEQQARDNWKYIRSVNWIYFDDDTAFDNSLKDLLTALDTDQVYVKSHTRYLVRALEWQQSHLNPSFLLEGDQLEAAHEWLTSSVGKHPEPHPVHHDYITASSVAEAARTARDKAREQLIRSSRRAAIGLGAGVVIAIIAAVVIGQQFIAARAEVTRAGATLQQVNLQVTDAINQQVTAAAKVQIAENLVATATIEQGNAVLAQQTSAAGESSASTRVAVAGATLSPVPPTLTAVAAAINDSNMQQEIALYLSDASLSIANKQPADALKIANNMISDYPDQPLAYLGRGLIYDTMGNTDEAIADYTQAIKLNPQYSTAYYNRAVAYETQNKLDEAIADYTQAIALDPQYTDALNNRGLDYAQQGKTDKAIADYTQAIAIDPQEAFAYNNRGLIYYDQDEFDKAIADYTQAIGINPDYAEALSNRGDAYMASSKPDQALADYNHALAADPKYAEAYNGRGYIYSTQRKMTEATADYWQWVELNTTESGSADRVKLGQTPFKTSVTMTKGYRYDIPFEASAGQRLQAQATAAEDAAVDPLLMLLDPQGKPIMVNDDISQEDTNAAITDYVLPANGTYTLVVTHTSSASEDDIDVTLDLKTAASAAPGPTPTPR